MFTSRLVTLAFVSVFAIVNVVAIPVPSPAEPNARFGLAMAQRDPAPFEPILAYVKRDVLDTDLSKRQDNVNTIPDTQATKGEDGLIVPFSKRQDSVNTIPDTQATKGEDGLIVPFSKRQDNVNTIPDTQATKGLGGEILPF